LLFSEKKQMSGKNHSKRIILSNRSTEQEDGAAAVGPVPRESVDQSKAKRKKERPCAEEKCTNATATWRFLQRKYLCPECYRHPSNRMCYRSTAMSQYNVTGKQIDEAVRKQGIFEAKIPNKLKPSKPCRLYYVQDIEKLASQQKTL
jgi:hypothetical protein